MKKKAKIILAAATLTIFSLTITAYQPKTQVAPPAPDVCPVSALTHSSRDNTPPPLVEYQILQTVPSQNGQSSTQNQPADNPMEEQNTTPPAPTSSEPKMGDTRIVNGQKQSYFLGFGWIDDMGENEVIYCEGMYENGNKIGIMGGGNVVDSDGDINKMVGIMD